MKTLIVQVLALPALAICMGTNAAEEHPSTAVFDQVWSHATLFQNQRNRIALSGRLQFDSAWFNADQGEFDDDQDQFNDMLWRRFRFGFKANFAGHWVAQLESEFNLNNELDNLYSRLTDAYIGYSPSNNWLVKVLKQSVGFTLDGATSSKKLLTLQRNNLTNNLWFTAEYFTGLSVSGAVNSRWFYKAGVFSSDGSNEIAIDSGGTIALLSLGYNFVNSLNFDKAIIRLDYVNNEEDDEANTPDFNQVMTLVTQWEKGKWGLWTDLSSGRGYGEQSDLWGISLMPFYSFTPFHQAILRYTYIDSSDDNGIKFGRYEREIVSNRGNRYNELYAGYNLFFYGHKLKWQTGLQYTTMEDDADDGVDYEGWGLTTGLRMSW